MRSFGIRPYAGLVAALALILVGCGADDGADPSTDSDTQEEASDSDQDVAAEADADDVTTLRIAHIGTPDSPYATTVSFMNERLDELTGGRLVLEEMGGGVLGGEAETLDLYATGDLDLGFHVSSVMAAVVEEYGIFDAPYLFADEDHWERTLVNGDGRDILSGWLDESEVPYSIGMMGHAGIRNVYTTGRIIDSLDSFEGMRKRTLQSPTAVRLWEHLGAIPTAVGFPEVYSALQTGIVEAAGNDPVWYVDAQHREVAQEFNWTQHLLSVMHLLVNNETVGALPQDLQDALWETFEEAEPFWLEAQRSASQAAADQFAESGVTEHTPPEDLADQVVEHLAPLVADIADELDVQDLVAYLNEQR